MEFKHWLNEIAAPAKPSGAVKKINIIKNPGTIKAKPVIEFRFKTKQGNVVKVHFDNRGDGVFEALFYVNDTMYDDSSTKGGSTKDYEILPSVLHVIKIQAPKLGAKKITFSAIQGQGRWVKKLDIEPVKNKAVQALEKFEITVQQYPVKMIPPSPQRIELFKKFNKGTPQPLPDLDTPTMLSHIERLKSQLDSISAINIFIENLYRIDWKIFGIDPKPLTDMLRKLEGAIESHSEKGWYDDTNRREYIYEKLFNKYFTDEWNVIKNGTSFELVRKYK